MIRLTAQVDRGAAGSFPDVQLVQFEKSLR